MESVADCRICGDYGQFNIFKDELCFDVKSKTKTKIYICLNNFLFEKLYAEDEHSSFICQLCCNSLCDAYSFMVFVRKAEQRQWKIEKPEELKESVEQVAAEDEIISDYCEPACEDEEEIIEELIEIEKPLTPSPPSPKKQKLSHGLPNSIQCTHYELEFSDKNVIVLQITAKTIIRSKSGFIFDSSFMNHKDENSIYQCQYCIKAFSNSEFLLKHITSVHLCTLCLNIADNYKDLNKHMQQHKKIICSFCNKICDTPASFRQHLKKQHMLQLPAHIGIIVET